MRARTVAAGLVVVAVAGSIGIVFAQKGLPWPGGAQPQAAAGQPAGPPGTGLAPAGAAPAGTAATEPRPVIRTMAQGADPIVVAQAGGQTGGQGGGLPRAGLPGGSGATPTAAPPPPSGPAVAKGPACTNPNALGVARVVEIDTTGGPGFGFEHFKQHDFLRPGEVVLTFDDGPWRTTTPLVLQALAQECVKATFFAIGLHATYYPDVLRQVYEAGHSVGSHTWSHANLTKKTPEEAKEEIEKGVSAARSAIGQPIAPFFRFPELKHPEAVVAYVGERNMAMFSTDLDSLDYKIKKPDALVKSVMTRLKKHGKGILLLHDQRTWTAQAMPQLLAELKQGGFKIVHVVGRTPLQSLAQYDAMIAKNEKLPTAGAGRPTSSVVRTIGE